MKCTRKAANSSAHIFPDVTTEVRSGLASLAALSILGGAAAGLVGACFRYLLIEGDELRNSFVDWARGYQVPGLLLVVTAAASAYGVGGLVGTASRSGSHGERHTARRSGAAQLCLSRCRCWCCR